MTRQAQWQLSKIAEGLCSICGRRPLETTRLCRECLMRSREVHAARNKRHPDRYRARYLAATAIRDGRLLRGPCEICGASKVDAHHDDYSIPLSVRWLCRVHHLDFHHR